MMNFRARTKTRLHTNTNGRQKSTQPIYIKSTNYDVLIYQPADDFVTTRTIILKHIKIIESKYDFNVRPQ